MIDSSFVLRCKLQSFNHSYRVGGFLLFRDLSDVQVLFDFLVDRFLFRFGRFALFVVCVLLVVQFHLGVQLIFGHAKRVALPFELADYKRKAYSFVN